jgi:hypothetical protein
MRRLGAKSAQTRASAASIVALEGGGFFPSLDLGGGGVATPGEVAAAPLGRAGA